MVFFLSSDVIANKFQIFPAKTHCSVTLLPIQPVPSARLVVNVMRTGTFQLTNPSADSDSGRNANGKMDVIFYSSHFEQAGARSFSDPMAQVSIQPVFNIRSDSASILFGMPRYVKQNFRKGSVGHSFPLSHITAHLRDLRKKFGWLKPVDWKAAEPALDNSELRWNPGLERPGLKPFGKGRWKRPGNEDAGSNLHGFHPQGTQSVALPASPCLRVRNRRLFITDGPRKSSGRFVLQSYHAAVSSDALPRALSRKLSANTMAQTVVIARGTRNTLV